MSSYVKGGAWTSIEDEILKAAVQKYGTNQWARVSSLLPKKTAAQAKSRWVEWLNPLINKSGWTPDQDKRLIELTRLLPNQWRSIASTIGRTATQCVQRYQQLIDEASENNGNDLKLSGPGIETLPAVGQSAAGIIDNDETNNDPNFAHETRPAHVGSDEDDDSMEDDDREMLAEAKARLSNTQGKKAKRKARERMLEESKRLALLQKRREMKAAGINISLRSKNKRAKKDFDYNADIPHEIVPPVGPYDVNEETRHNEMELEQFRNQVAKQGVSLKEVDEKVSVIKEKPRDEKKRRRPSDAMSEPRELDTRRGIEFKKQKVEAYEPAVQEKEIESASQLRSPKKPKKAIVPVLKSLFEHLPEPKHHQGKPTSIFDEVKSELQLPVGSYDTLNSNMETQPEVLPTFDQGKSKQRRSQAIQRDLPIPNPLTAEKFSNFPQAVGLQEELAQEFRNLIGLDYRKYKDPSFCASLKDDLGQEIYDKVNKEVDDEWKKLQETNEGRLLEPPKAESLLRSFEAAEKVIGKLHALHDKSQSLLSSSVNTSHYEAESDGKWSRILQHFQDLAALDAEYALVQSTLNNEKRGIDVESKRLKLSVDRIFDCVESIRQRIISNSIHKQ